MVGLINILQSDCRLCCHIKISLAKHLAFSRPKKQAIIINSTVEKIHFKTKIKFLSKHLWFLKKNQINLNDETLQDQHQDLDVIKETDLGKNQTKLSKKHKSTQETTRYRIITRAPFCIENLKGKNDDRCDGQKMLCLVVFNQPTNNNNIEDLNARTRTMKTHRQSQ